MSSAEAQLAVLGKLALDWAPTAHDVWTLDEKLHVGGLHTQAWDALVRAFEEARERDTGCPLGVVVHGEPGLGKTHLLSRFREHVQGSGGYFVRLVLGDDPDFWNATLVSFRDSLLRPTTDRPTQLARLLVAFTRGTDLSRQQRSSAADGGVTLTPDGLDSLVNAVCAQRPAIRPYHSVLRALLLMANGDTRLGDLGWEFLANDGGVARAAERARWGLPPSGFRPAETVRAISMFLAETGPTVVAIDQIDTLLAQSTAAMGEEQSAPGADLERVAHGLMELREQLSRTVTAVFVLPAAWEVVTKYATATVPDRFRVAPALAGIPDGEIARAIVAQRLGVRYAALNYTPAHSTWPVAPGAFSTAAHMSPREVLMAVDAHARNVIESGAVSELTKFGDARFDPPKEPLDLRFAQLREAAEVNAMATDQAAADKHVPDLLAAGLQAWVIEQGDDRFLLDQVDGRLSARLRRTGATPADEARWSFRAIPHPHFKAVISRVEKAVAAVAFDGAGDRKLFFLRSTPWPKGAATTKVTEDARKRGAQVFDLDASDLSSLAALRTLLEENPPGLDDWLRATRPAHGLDMFRGLPAAPGAGTTSTADEASDSDSEPATARGRADTSSPAPAHRGGSGAANADAKDSGTGFGTAEAGRLPIGRDHNGAVVSVDPLQLRKHTAIFAGSGSGKTVLIRRLIEECALLGISSIVFDTNNDLSRLGTPWPQTPSSGWGPDDADRAARFLADTDVVVWTPNHQDGRPLSFQPLPEFGTLRSNEGEFNRAVDVTTSSLAPYAKVGGAKGEQQRAILKEALTAYGKEINAPSMGGFTEFLGGWTSEDSRLSSADRLAPELANNITAAMINNPLLGGSGTPVDPEVLLTPAAGKRARVSVISFIGLPDESQQQTFIRQLQMALFAWVKRHPAGDRPLSGLLVMDEAQRIAPSGGLTPSTDSTLLLASQARKFGLGLLFATQGPKDVHTRITGNASTQFYGKLGSSAQINAAREQAAARHAKVDGIGTLRAGEFFLLDESGSTRLSTPLCLSHHPASPPTEEDVLAIARRSTP